jgi:anaerobic C4-dicarboxylate transporter
LFSFFGCNHVVQASGWMDFTIKHGNMVEKKQKNMVNLHFPTITILKTLHGMKNMGFTNKQ